MSIVYKPVLLSVGHGAIDPIPEWTAQPPRQVQRLHHFSFEPRPKPPELNLRVCKQRVSCHVSIPLAPSEEQNLLDTAHLGEMYGDDMEMCFRCSYIIYELVRLQ
jgi:hypothetical protein